MQSNNDITRGELAWLFSLSHEGELNMISWSDGRIRKMITYHIIQGRVLNMDNPQALFQFFYSLKVVSQNWSDQPGKYKESLNTFFEFNQHRITGKELSLRFLKCQEHHLEDQFFKEIGVADNSNLLRGTQSKLRGRLFPALLMQYDLQTLDKTLESTCITVSQMEQTVS